jgi:tRNA nucleotidyltransferase (CCA-adding enzyme)
MTGSDEALAALRAVVPATVREVCKVLTGAGHQAVTVGGAVRDALLGREPGDWDVATSARPEDVIDLFPRTIPTGLQHGTVTVMIKVGGDRLPVEVTTFRGEGAYSDARRPDHVVFGVPLHEDLARRDLVVNAIAYDPEREELIDPFDGRGDIARRVLRAVGDPVARFTEDGLRVMRAIRFAAVLEFALDPATEAAIPEALPSLAKVSRERVHDELDKLLASPAPSVGLVIAARTGLLAQILPELAGSSVTWARVDAAPSTVRLAALLAGIDARVVDDVLRRLKYSNQDRDLAVRLARVATLGAGGDPAELEVRRALSTIGRPAGAPAVALWRARAAAGEGGGYASAADRAQAILDRGDALATGDLAITGSDLLTELGLPPGKQIGQILAALLDEVLRDPAANQREALLARARALAAR